MRQAESAKPKNTRNFSRVFDESGYTRFCWRNIAGVTGGLNPRIDGEACAGEDKGAVEAPGLINGMAIQSDGLSVASSV
jgi:hypothetical protein